MHTHTVIAEQKTFHDLYPKEKPQNKFSHGNN